MNFRDDFCILAGRNLVILGLTQAQPEGDLTLEDSTGGGVLQEKIGYRFSNRDLLGEALTHKSYSNEQVAGNAPHNERLEFLGDAVLELAISERAFDAFPDFPEGELTRVRAELVSEASLARVARVLDLGAGLRLGRGEERTGGRDKPSLLADALEALLGAVFCDGGFAAARQVVGRLFGAALDAAARRKLGSDYKTRLQELLQGTRGRAPRYRLVEASGPDHQRSYRVEVLCGEEVLGAGSGRSKKAAEQAAARQALEAVGG